MGGAIDGYRINVVVRVGDDAASVGDAVQVVVSDQAADIVAARDIAGGVGVFDTAVTSIV